MFRENSNENEYWEYLIILNPLLSFVLVFLHLDAKLTINISEPLTQLT